MGELVGEDAAGQLASQWVDSRGQGWDRVRPRAGLYGLCEGISGGENARTCGSQELGPVKGTLPRVGDPEGRVPEQAEGPWGESEGLLLHKVPSER